MGGICVCSRGWRTSRALTHAPILFLREHPILGVPSGTPWLGRSLIGAVAAQAESTRRSKTLWFQWTEKVWKKKPRHSRERARDRTHRLTLFSPPLLPTYVLLLSYVVLASASALHLSPAVNLPGNYCKVHFSLVFVNTNFTTWDSLDPAPRCISQQ